MLKEMKKTLLILLFSFLVFSCFSQEKYTRDVPKNLKKTIKNFEKHKYSEEYPLFEGNITLINDSVIQSDDIFIKLYNIHNDYKPIFYRGILYPILYEEKNNITCAIIRNFREIKGKKQDYKIKRFIFELSLLSDCDMIRYGYSPKYLIELKNENATKSTSIAEFIMGARLISRWAALYRN